jgi:putative phosphoesterase
MRICIMSDIHSNYVALQEVLREVAYDLYVVAGDIIGYYTWPNEVVGALARLPVKAVRGNHDEAAITGDTSWFNDTAASALEWNRRYLSVETVQYLSQLPTTLEFEADGKKFFVCHGSPRDPLYEYVYPDMVDSLELPDTDFLILGHTHIQFHRRLGNLDILNPGSVGQPRDGDPRLAYAVYDTKTGELALKRKSYDFHRVIDAIAEAGLADWLGERLMNGI